MKVSSVLFVVSDETKQVSTWHNERTSHHPVYHTGLVWLVWPND